MYVVRRLILMLTVVAIMAAMVATSAMPVSAKEANFGRNASTEAKSNDGEPEHGKKQSGFAIFKGPHGCYDPQESEANC